MMSKTDIKAKDPRVFKGDRCKMGKCQYQDLIDAQTEKQHYMSRFYLKNFFDNEGKIYRANKYGVSQITSPKSIANIKNFYGDTLLDDGIVASHHEQEFNSTVETKVSQAYKYFLFSGKIDIFIKKLLSKWLAGTYARSLYARNHIIHRNALTMRIAAQSFSKKDITTFTRLIKAQNKTDARNKLIMASDYLLQHDIKKHIFSISSNHTDLLCSNSKFVKDLQKLFFSSEWIMLHTKEDIILGDTFFLHYPNGSSNIPFADLESYGVIFIPLGPRRILAVNTNSPDYKLTENMGILYSIPRELFSEVDKFNESVMMYSMFEAYSRSNLPIMSQSAMLGSVYRENNNGFVIVGQYENGAIVRDFIDFDESYLTGNIEFAYLSVFEMADMVKECLHIIKDHS